MVVYLVYDEDGELMRKVRRKEEAEALCSTREGWEFRSKRETRKQFDLSKCEEAPF